MADYRKFEEGRDQGDFSLLPELHASLSCLKVRSCDSMLILLHINCQPWRHAAKAVLDLSTRACRFSAMANSQLMSPEQVTAHSLNVCGAIWIEFGADLGCFTPFAGAVHLDHMRGH